MTGPRRQCGGCTLCCKLLPIPGLGKAANQRCKHQRHGKGCAIYERRPTECGVWFCRWLINDDTATMSRPDRAHYVIDMMPDYITLTAPDGVTMKIAAVQIWCDPDYPLAHRDPELRAWLERKNLERPVVAIVRFNARDAITLLPPAVAGEWIEHESGIVVGGHTFEETQAVWQGDT